MSDYYTKSEIEEKGYQTEEQVRAIVEEGSGEEVDLSNYYTKAETDKKIADAATGDVDLTGYYTKTETDTAIEQAVAAIEIPSTTGLATEKYVNDAIEAIDIPEVNLDEYAKKTDIPSTTGLATEQYVNEKVANIVIPEVKDEVYVGADAPADTNVKLWIDTDENVEFATMAEVEAKGYQTEEQVNALIEASGGSGSGGGSADVAVFTPMTPAGSEIVDYKIGGYTAPTGEAKADFISNYSLKPNITYYISCRSEWGTYACLGTTIGGSEITTNISYNASTKAIMYSPSNDKPTGFTAYDFNSSLQNYIAFKILEAAAGEDGLVPAPSKDDAGKVLTSDKGWQLNTPVIVGTKNEIFNDISTNAINDKNGNNNHIEGSNNTLGTSSGSCNHIEGNGNKITGSYNSANHAEGLNNTITGAKAHVEGQLNKVEADCAHAEGYKNTVSTTSASQAHAEGSNNTVSKQDAHVEGSYNLASSAYQHVQGKYNIEDSSNVYADIVGNGNSSARSNAYTLDWSGNATYAGTITSASGADYAEYFEWADGNPEGEDRVGYIVKLNGDKIEFANETDDVLGVISGTMTVLGDNAEWHWQGKYLTDDFGRIIYDLVEDYRTTIDDITGEEKTELVGTFPAPRINPDYDETKPYTNRKERAEWDAVGMMGKLYVRDDGTAQVNGYVVANNGIATATENRTNMRVMERVSDNIIRVCLK